MTDTLELYLIDRIERLTPEQRDEWARRAVKTFQSMEYLWTAFARVLTGNPAVRVVMASGSPRTDGTTIYYRPPLMLGDPSPHIRNQCDRRNANGHLICPACSARESVERSITHEISHIVGGSFQKSTPDQQQTALRRAVIYAQNPIARAHLEAAMRRVQWGDDPQVMMFKMSPFLGLTIMALEDARIDIKMFKARPGVRKMFASSAQLMSTVGSINLDGEVIRWSERPLNAQIIIGLLWQAEGFGLGNLHNKVKQDLQDPVLQDICARVDRSGSALEIAALTIECLVRLWELGYCEPPEDMPEPPPYEPPPPQNEEQDDQDESDSKGGSDGSDSPEDQGDSDSHDGSEEPSEEDPGGTGQDSSGAGDGSSGDENLDSSGTPDPGPDGGSEETSGDGVSDSGSDESKGIGDSEDPGDNGERGDGPGEPGKEPSDEPGEPGEQLGNDDGAEEANSTPEAELDSGSDAEDSSGEGIGAESEEQADPSGSGDDGSSPDESDQGGDVSDSTETGSVEPLEDPGRESADGADQAGSEAGGSPTSQPSPGSESMGSGDSGSGTGNERDGEATSDLATPDEADSTQGAETSLGGDSGTGTPEPEPEDLPDHGSADDVAELIQDFTGHTHEDDEHLPALQGAEPAVEQAVDKAIVQNKYFDAPTASVSNLRVYTWPKDDKRCEAWKRDPQRAELTIRIGDRDRQGRDQWDILRTPEDILQPAMFEMNRVFSDNQRSRDDRNLKRGKLDGRALGKRAWKGDDDRLYKKRDRPKKRDYAVIIAGDCSWSQHLGKTMVVTKQAMFAQAELLHRMGIAFEVWAHTAEVGRAYLKARRKGDDDVEPDFEMVMNQIKSWTDPWNQQHQEGLAWLHAVETNLDGHNLEFLRKRLMMTDATDKILLYYTDGEMPAANYEDELEVLKRELDLYKRLGILIVGVGVGTDSPREYGLDTVRIDNKGDIGKVVKHLEGELTRMHR